MPVISMFYGIIVQMFVLDADRHHEPHIHARYAEHTASIAIATGSVLAGSLTSPATSLGAGLDRDSSRRARCGLDSRGIRYSALQDRAASMNVPNLLEESAIRPTEPMAPDAVSVEVTGETLLRVALADARIGSFDVSELLRYPAYEALKNPAYFRSASVAHGVVCWPGGEDIAPETLSARLVVEP